MKLKNPAPAQNQWTDQPTRTKKPTLPEYFLVAFFEKILDQEI